MVHGSVSIRVGSDVWWGVSFESMYGNSGGGRFVECFEEMPKSKFGSSQSFDRMRFKNVFAWTEMMSGYLQNGDPDETVLIFREMLRRQLEMNEVTLLTLLPACSLVGGLLGVEEVHEFSVKKGFANHTSLCNSLIDMYSKNGLLSYAVKVFDHGCFSKDAITWSSVISGYGLHGKGQEAVVLYDKMLTSGIKPDAISVVGVLSACSRSGLVEKGLDVYDKAINVYGIEPTMEMCSCVVDLLGRSDHETRVLAYKALIEVEPENPSNYVSLSNIYASSKKWDSVVDVRRKMNERSLRKLPGCSWITIDSKTHSFSADKAHLHPQNPTNA
ncbi:pentatricopeptide repeat-containing protein [Tanacetum coccineum]